MRQLVPHYILENAAESRYSGSFQACTMFIDVSGFTQMTHALMKNGKEGAEILTDIINRVFTPAIDTIYNHRGFVSTFAGDAFTAIFPLDQTDEIAPAMSATQILQTFEVIGEQQTRFGTFNLSVKIGISKGEVEWKTVQSDEQNSFFFRGTAIDGAAACEKKCSVGNAILDFPIQDSRLLVHSHGEGFYRIEYVSEIIANNVRVTAAMTDGLDRFAPRAVLSLTIPGEFRDIVSLFVSFDERCELAHTLPEMIRLTMQYGGYFNKIDFGDKGGIALILFGAPVGREKMFARACDCALALRQIPGMRLRIGMTFGTAFTGFVGSKTRCEYTALGMVVNLSARFAMGAQWSEIYVDRYFAANLSQDYQIDFIDERAFKGFPEAIPVYSLKQRIKRKQQVKFTGSFVGRKGEIARLEEFLEPLGNHRFGGIIYLDGAAGTGKSRIVHELSSHMDEFRWIDMPCDGILRKSFNPVQHFLEIWFEQDEYSSPEVNRVTFDRLFDAFLKQVIDQGIRNELQRTRSVIGGLLGLQWENSLYEQLDARGRYENTLYALKTLIIAISNLNPLVIVFDDAHYMDPDTINWLKTLTRNVNDESFAIILPCRFQDNGASCDYSIESERNHRVQIDNLDEKTALEMVARFFGKAVKDIPSSTFRLVWSKSSGNPFYIEQILLYLQENDLVSENLTLNESNIDIPSKINEIIIARVDRLTGQVRQAVQTASVLGREFPVNILSKMLLSFTRAIEGGEFEDIVEEARRENIWLPLQKLRYIFSNTLIREVVYGTQLKQRLRDLHKLAAETIREAFAADIEQHFSDLAFHYEHAEINAIAIEYLEKASNHAKRNYQNDAALQFRTRQIKLFQEVLSDLAEDEHPTSVQQKQVGMLILALLEAKYFHQVLGHIDEANAAVERASGIAHKWGSRLDIAKTDLDKANLLKLSGKYDECESLLQEALSLFKQENELKMMGLTYLELGVLSFWQGKQKDAFAYFEQELGAFEQLGEPLRVAEALGNLGVVYRYTGDFEKSTEYLKKQLGIAEKQGDKIQISRTLGNLGWVLDGQEKYREALDFYRKALKINRELGLKSEMIRMLDNIGYVLQCIGEYAQALVHHQSALEFARETNDIESLINIHANMALASKLSSDTRNAHKHFEMGLALIEQYGMTHSLPEFLIEKADLLLTEGKRDEATKLAREGLQKAEEINNAEFVEKGKKLLEKIGPDSK